MAKTLLFILIAVVVYLLLRSRRSASPAAPRQPSAGAENIVACSRCGVHVPLSESVEVGGRRYCCPEHGRLG